MEKKILLLRLHCIHDLLTLGALRTIKKILTGAPATPGSQLVIRSSNIPRPEKVSDHHKGENRPKLFFAN